MRHIALGLWFMLAVTAAAGGQQSLPGPQTSVQTVANTSPAQPQPQTTQDKTTQIQSVPPDAALPSARPLPDIASLMLAVEEHQKTAEAQEKDYIYRETMRNESLDSRGNVKKTELEEHDVFRVEGVLVRKLISKDGKPLSPDEAKKESERIDKEVAKAKERKEKAQSKGEQTDSNGFQEVTLSRMLELGTFTNERRQQVGGRDTILVDFVGDPKAKTRNPLENAIHEMGGTIWVDEQDKAAASITGVFVNDFKIGGGLLVKVKKGTSFDLRNVKVNDEVWLPAQLNAHGEARALLLFGIDGRVQFTYSDYRKFGARSTIRPGFQESPAQPSPPPPPN